ncbi:LiaF transmembrane domain-containing protein [Haloarchaeobius litoreus]|uniref:LiaF domain-containing protein n=1 Tax=Haloarchaeobius litoreus TaxID=755306 RepID=A0ABD6DNY8_9EURY|nr:LiaF domain-containing protein [Haloarchaeobius litoreus]
MSTTSTRRFPSVQILFGALVVVLGALLLLDTTGLFPTTDLLLYAPSLFVVVGLWALVQSRLRNIVGPVVLVTIGAAWQAVALDLATVDDVIVFWPVLVIAFGLSVILGTYRAKTVPTEDAYTSMFAAFGGVERRNTSKAFTGADLTALFGAAEIDLRDAEITDRPARINAVALFGAAEVIVPRDWNVQMDVLPVLGAAEDSRRRSETVNDEVDLVVGGFTAFGGIEVKD